MTVTNDLIEEALEQCATEPVHIPGHIQPAGALLAFDRATRRLTHVSANAQTYLGAPTADVLGQSMAALLGRDIEHGIKNAEGTSSFERVREHIGRIETPAGPCYVSAFASASRIVCEIETAAQDDAPEGAVLREVERMMDYVRDADDETDVLQRACWMLQAVSGYDHVMAYRFDAEYNGEILAEALNSALEPMLGLRFPKWDIPAQARDIMKRLPIRFICDVDQEPVPILAREADAEPLDITLANTRGVSPVHIQYLRNMGVQATMTLSLVVNDRLWGMFSFHHAAPRIPSPRIRELCSAFRRFFVLKLDILQKDRDLEMTRRIDTLRRELQNKFDAEQSMRSLFDGFDTYISDIFRLQGIVEWTADAPRHFGNVPSQKVLDAALKEAREQAEPIWAANDLRLRFDNLDDAEFGGVGGMLIVLLPENRYLALCRDQKTRTISWAGAPEKQIDVEDGMARLTPRGSFSLYMQHEEHLSEPWGVHDLQLAESLLSTMISAERRMLDHIRSRQNLMIDELNHRVRNILALIRSVSRQARKSNETFESYRAALEQRINALAAAHDLGSGQGVDSVYLRRIISLETNPYLSDDPNRVSVTGEEYWIVADKAPLFALLLHELATNAAKYGALSTPDGRLSIHIGKDADGVRLTWQEEGGPQVVAPENRGFGSTLIESAVPYELGGSSELSFLSEGLRADIWIPLEVFVVNPTQAAPGDLDDATLVAPPEELRLPEGKVLLVEDNFMLTIDMVDMLKEVGVKKVITAANVTDALRAIELSKPYFAVLDVNLGVSGETSDAVAGRLRSLNIPFAFATGYGSDSLVTSEYDVPILTKPINAPELAAAMKRALAR